MDKINLTFAVFLPSLIGFLSASLLLKDDIKMTVFDRIFFGYGLGMGFVSYGMFILGLVNIKYTLLNITLYQILLFTGMTALLVYRKMPFSKILGQAKLDFLSPGTNKWKYAGVGVLMLWLSFKILFVLYEGLNRPIYSWDTWANWSAGAKFIFYEKGLLLDPNNEFFFGKGYRVFLGHPLHSSLIQVWLSLCIGEFHEIYAKAWAPFYFISLVGLFFLAVKKDASLVTALIATLLLSSSPFLTYHGIDAYSDLPMSYYAFASTISFWRYIKTGNRDLLILCGIFSGMGMFTKNEGIFFTAAILISLIVFIFLEKRQDKRGILYFLIPVGIIIGPWILLKLIYNIGYGHEITQKFVGLGITIQAIKEFAEAIFLEANFNIVFAFLFVMTVLDIKLLLKEQTRFIFIIIFLVAGMFFSVYVMSLQEFNESLAGRMAVNRNILTYLPITYFLAAIVAFKAWSEKSLPAK